MKLVRGVVVALLVSTAAWAGNPLDDAKQELLLGDQARNQGNYDVALAHYNAARLLVPDRPGPYASLGLVYAEMGKCPEAIDAFDQYFKRLKKEPNADAAAANDRCKAIVAKEAEEKKQREDAQRAREAAAQQEQQRREADAARQSEEQRQRNELQASEQRRLNRIAEAKHQEDDQVNTLIRTERVSICDPISNPTASWKGDVFWFCSLATSMTENDFLRKYEQVTGSHEASHAITWRNKGTVIVLSITAAASIALAGWGLGTFHHHCDPVTDFDNSKCTNSSGMFDTDRTFDDSVAETVGLIGVLTGTLSVVFLIPSLIRHDGTAIEHTLTRMDAERLARNYNLALERRARQQLGLTSEAPVIVKPRPRVSVTPYFGGTSLGIVGQF
jgi:tetratricopeptide (TPR) repeat protein